MPVSAGSLDKTGTQWSPYLEWSVWDTSYSVNPFHVNALVTFSHAGSGESHTTRMFYAGNDTWKFRFTGTKTGIWTFASSSADADLDGLSGTVTIDENSNPDEHGFLTHIGNKWAWSGTGRAFVPQLVMYDDPSRFYNNPSKVDDDIDTFFNGHGFNGFHTRVYCRWFDLQEEYWDSLSAEPEPDSLTFQALEMLIEKVYAAGGMVHIWMWGDNESHRTIDYWGKGSAADIRLQRYIAARLGPLPGWTMGYGYDLDEWVAETEIDTWQASMQNYLGWFHFMGGRSAGPNSGTDHTPYITWNDGMDYSGYEHHKPSHDVYAAAMGTLTSQPVMSEDRFRVYYDGSVNPNTVPKLYYEYETIRGLYHSTLAGGAANIWGCGKPDFTEGYGSTPYDSAAIIKTYFTFFENRFTADMSPDNAITDGYCLKRPTRAHYIFYKEAAGAIQMDLSDMESPKGAIAVDTMSPYCEISLDTLLNADTTWTAPYESDWIVAVGYFGEVCSLQCKVYLEGAYNIGIHMMNLNLRTNNYIPTTAPYDAHPRTVSAVPELITDWIIIGLRETMEGPDIAVQSVFLRQDGNVVNMDGTCLQIPFDIAAGDYYVTVNHRNHISVISKSVLAMDPAVIATMDFSIDDSQYYEDNAKMLEEGVYGLFRGDPNRTDFVNSADYLYVKNDIGSAGYYNSDVNFTGLVNSADYLAIKTNIGESSSVP